VKPIAKTLGITPSSYRAAGADKVWDQLNKDGVPVARCTVERLMAHMGLQGCRRGRMWIRTTEGDVRLDRPADLVERHFRAPAPNLRLWVAELIFVRTHSGFLRRVRHRRVLPGGRRPASITFVAI
jgi:putative transposase